MKRILLALLLAGCAAAGMQQSPPAPVASPAVKSGHHLAILCKRPNRHRHRCVVISASVAVDPSHVIGPNTSDVLGADLDDTNGSDFTQTPIPQAFATAGITALRMPAGYISNVWDYSNNMVPTAAPCTTAVPTQPASPDTVQAAYILAGTHKLHLVVNAGADINCTHDIPAPTATAVAFVNYVYGSGSGGLSCRTTQCNPWTISNEFYTTEAIDNGCMGQDSSHEVGDPTCAAPIFQSFINAMHGANSNASLCVQADPQHGGPYGGSWDSTIFNGTSVTGFSCVDAHYYAGWNYSDADLLAMPYSTAAPNRSQGNDGGFALFMTTLKADIMALNPRPYIVIGEYGSSPSSKHYSVQDQSIVQAIFDAEMIGEMLNNSVTMAHIHTAVSRCVTPSPQASAYGQWLGFSGAMAISLGDTMHCPAGSKIGLPVAGTPLPQGAAIEVASKFAKIGTIVKNTVTDPTGSGMISCYSSILGTPSAKVDLLCVNRSMHNSYLLSITVLGKSSCSATTGVYYDKAAFDLTQGTASKWVGPSTVALPACVSGIKSVTLTPWSIEYIPFG